MTLVITPAMQQQCNTLLAEDPHMPIAQMAQVLQLKEAEVTFALSEQLVRRAKGEHAEHLLKLLPEFGTLTTIVHSAGSIFEFKGDFPTGKLAQGYYNLITKGAGLHGHLRIDLITDIAFVSKDFRGMQSHYIGFFDANADCVFKVYLGRDKKRQLFPEQIARFMALKTEYCQVTGE